jgi:hypothetical protein
MSEPGSDANLAYKSTPPLTEKIDAHEGRCIDQIRDISGFGQNRVIRRDRGCIFRRAELRGAYSDTRLTVVFMDERSWVRRGDPSTLIS